MLGSSWLWVLEFMEGVGYILCHGEANYSLVIIVPIYFDAKLYSSGTINVHRVTFSDGLYEMIFMLFSYVFYSKISNNQWKCDRSPFVITKSVHVSEFFYPFGYMLFVRESFSVILACVRPYIPFLISAYDLFQPNMYTFSTHALVWVHFKTVY